MNFSLSFFSYKAKIWGFILVVLALPFAYLYFWGGKPEIFNIKTFALLSIYFETRFFVISQTNILDELAAILFLSGISLVSFSKEKNEKQHYDLLRSKALVNALFISIIIWIISFLIIYGMAIFIVSFGIFIIYLINYNLFFRYYLIQNKKNPQNSEE